MERECEMQDCEEKRIRTCLHVSVPIMVKSIVMRICFLGNRCYDFFLTVLMLESGLVLVSFMIMPRIPTFTRKNMIPDAQSPGTKVERPLNSSWKPCWSQANCPRIHSTSEVMPIDGRRSNVESGR
jgi:hypothetical protein